MGWANAPAMRIHVFATAVLVIVLGAAGLQFIPKMAGFEFMRGILTLGGALFICGIFMIRMYWHGVIGAGVVALIGAGRGILNITDVFAWFSGERGRGVAPVLELAITVLCGVLVLRVVRVLLAERTRRMLEQGL